MPKGRARKEIELEVAPEIEPYIRSLEDREKEIMEDITGGFGRLRLFRKYSFRRDAQGRHYVVETIEIEEIA